MISFGRSWKAAMATGSGWMDRWMGALMGIVMDGWNVICGVKQAMDGWMDEWGWDWVSARILTSWGGLAGLVFARSPC